jgi:hypothetical protein
VLAGATAVIEFPAMVKESGTKRWFALNECVCDDSPMRETRAIRAALAPRG